jgi:LAO/AO transport system kinase
VHELAKRIIDQDVRALARGITYIENDHPQRMALLKDLHPYKNRAFKVGITGAPGAGKSSLVNRLITLIREKLELTVGVLAVDPTSPFTGGALLGDRIRLSRHFTDPGVFIRSMGTRGSLGGLARATKEAVHLLDAYAHDVIIIETVGVGQTELDIMNVADSTLVVLTPNGGDTVQAFKAGIMEIADLYVINKADLPGSEKLVTEIEQMLDLVKHDAAWRPPIVKTVSTENKGIVQLWQALVKHRQYLQQSGEGERRSRKRAVDEVRDVLEQQFHFLLQQKLQHPSCQHALLSIEQGHSDPYSVAQEWFEQLVNRQANELGPEQSVESGEKEG